MTVAALAARSNERRQHLLVVLLALSLALNLCFVAGALWIRIHGPPPVNPEERLERIGAQLGLDPQQRAAFEQYSQAMRAKMQQAHDAVEPLIGKAWGEVAKPDADEAKVVQLFDEANQTRRSFMRELAPLTLSFLATLTPQQRAKFVELIRERPRERPH